mmetsp:Transcript_93701/g.269889  ORF Transcript_93701/g.269889 Transcript_93701/m.269889 type:complete len:358 (+) Transcript_93701:169-1242(+)
MVIVCDIFWTALRNSFTSSSRSTCDCEVWLWEAFIPVRAAWRAGGGAAATFSSVSSMSGLTVLYSSGGIGVSPPLVWTSTASPLILSSVGIVMFLFTRSTRQSRTGECVMSVIDFSSNRRAPSSMSCSVKSKPISSHARLQRNPPIRSMPRTQMYVETAAKAAMATKPMHCMPNCSHAAWPPPNTKPLRSLWQCGWAKMATHKVPQAAGQPCAATAPTVSSSCRLSINTHVLKVSKAPTNPTNNIITGGMTWQQAQLDTKPPRTAFVKSGTLMIKWRLTINAHKMLAIAPPEAAINVVTVVLAESKSVLSVVASVDAGLKPKKPTSNKNVPKSSCTGLLHGLIFVKTAFSISNSGNW